jgi:D-3-phosphoglycerate dehydrogenase
MRILLTTTSFQDTPGSFHDLLASKGYEIIRQRGPLPEARMLELVGGVDGLLCGDDAITRAVLQKALPRLKVISKYGIGLDKIDLKAATELKIPVCFTPGVNHTAVAEQTFLLLLALEKNFLFGVDATRQGQWKRKTGREIMGKTLGIVGLGRIGREVAIRARAFGLEVIAHDIYWDEPFAAGHGVRRAATVNEIFSAADYITLHTNLTPETRGLINAASLAKMKRASSSSIAPAAKSSTPPTSSPPSSAATSPATGPMCWTRSRRRPITLCCASRIASSRRTSAPAPSRASSARPPCP